MLADAAVSLRRHSFAAVVFIVALITYTAQTELTQYVQTTLDYRKPYLTLYIAHSSYTLILPAQACYFYWKYGGDPRDIIRRWMKAFATIGTLLTPFSIIPWKSSSSYRPLQSQRLLGGIIPGCLLRLELTIAIFIAVPSLSWFVSVSLTSMPNITAIFNSSCFFAYIFSIWMLREDSVPIKWFAVLLSLAGVAVMTYGSSRDDRASDDSASNTQSSSLVGDLIVTFGAITYAYYEVFYKKYASPDPNTFLLATDDEEDVLVESPIPSTRLSQEQLMHFSMSTQFTLSKVTFANTITGFIGVITLFLFWIPLIPLHILRWEPFQLPWVQNDGSVSLYLFMCVMLVAILGVMFNACFMILIALTTPLIASVGNLLTIILVAVSDWFITHHMISIADLIGSGLMVLAFIILLIAESSEKKKTLPGTATTIFVADELE